jgi:hypothetical protein
MRKLLSLIVVALAPLTAAAQQTGAPSEPGSELTIYLMTMGPGDAIWEKFGHNAIWIRDASTGSDIAYNYGMFSFDEPGYLGRFLRGDMRYWMQPEDGPYSARVYAAHNRSVWLQELNLTPAQRVKLREFLEWNAREENRFYAYDYYRDNCSTRVRDAIDQVLDGGLKASLEPRSAGTTYRDHSLRLTAAALPAYTGLLLGLGPMVDRPLSQWEEGFIPMQLMAHIRSVNIAGPDGASVPLVLSEQTVFEATRPAGLATPPDRTPLYLAVGLLLAGLVVLAGKLAAGRRGGGLLAVAILWSLVAGLFGVVLAALWTFTSHASAYRNENLFQVNPLSLAVVGLLVFAAVRPDARRAAAVAAIAIAAISVLGFIAQAAPGLDQVNGGIIALALPVHVAVAWSVWRWSGLSSSRDARSSGERTPPPAGGSGRR